MTNDVSAICFRDCELSKGSSCDCECQIFVPVILIHRFWHTIHRSREMFHGQKLVATS